MSTIECGVCRMLEGPREQVVYEDELWQVRPIGQPWGVPGWMLMIAREHVAGVAHFDERRAADLGPRLKYLESALEEVTGALRIYTAMLGETYQHFHAHMVPRSAEMPKGAKGWSVFDLERAARDGEIEIRDAEMLRVISEYRVLLSKRPAPR